VKHKTAQRQPQIPPTNDASVDKLIHLALPVRLTHMGAGERNLPEMACTYDIHLRGARLLSFRDVKVGDLITVERGRNKSICQVVWTGDPKSTLRGQFTVECVEGTRSPWEDELRQMQEQYLPIVAGKKDHRPSLKNFKKDGQNRRRSPRFSVAGGADLSAIGGESHVDGQLEQISQHGCMISTGNVLTAGTGLRIVLNIYDVSVALKGDVKYAAKGRSMGVEFNHIRQGDRPLLDYVLGKLQHPGSDEFADLEVITEALQAMAG
jgi:hypothetical protein